LPVGGKRRRDRLHNNAEPLSGRAEDLARIGRIAVDIALPVQTSAMSTPSPSWHTWSRGTPTQRSPSHCSLARRPSAHTSPTFFAGRERIATGGLGTRRTPPRLERLAL